MTSPLGLDRSDEFWQVGNVENHQQLLKADGGSHQDPSVLLEFFSVLEVFGQFDESCGHRKKLRRNKRTSEIFRWWLFSMDLLREETAERHFDGMEAD